MMQQFIKGQGLQTDCWPHVHLSADKGEETSVRRALESFSRCSLTRREIATNQIRHDARLAPVPQAEKVFSYWVSN